MFGVMFLACIVYLSCVNVRLCLYLYKSAVVDTSAIPLCVGFECVLVRRLCMHAAVFPSVCMFMYLLTQLS